MKTILTILFCLLLSFTARAEMVDLVWDASPTPDGITAYVLFERMPDGSAREVAKVDGKTLTASAEFGLGKHTLFVTARAGTFESLPSAPYVLSILPGAPGAPRRKESISPIAIPSKP